MKLAGLFCGLLVAALPLQASAYRSASGGGTEILDLEIVGGRVIDPETRLDAIRNVGIKDGKIVSVTSERRNARRKIDASGLIVSPGFIDLHAHGQHLVGQRLQAMDGVTTAIDMENGAYPVEPYFADRTGKALINYGIAASHVCIRIALKSASQCPQLNFEGPVREAPGDGLGISDRRPFLEAANDAEVDKILAAFRHAVDHGALGVGIGLEYEPGVGRQEVYQIFGWAAKNKVPVFVHVRRRQPDGAPGVALAVVQELIANAAATGAALQIVHVTSTGQNDTPAILDLVRNARSRGVDVTTEAYPYTAGSTVIGSALFDEGWRDSLGIDYSDVEWPATGERLTRDTFDAYRRAHPEATVIVHLAEEQIVRQAVADPSVSIASDGMPWRTQKEHPRGSGTFSRVLGRYVRDERLLDWMTAIGKMTLLPARRMQDIAPAMARKGRVQVGADADLAIFDPLTISDRATFDAPMRPSQGMQYVLVRGVAVVDRGKIIDDARPGQAIVGASVQ